MKERPQLGRSEIVGAEFTSQMNEKMPPGKNASQKICLLGNVPPRKNAS